MRTTTTQAPSVNLVTPSMTKTTNVTTAPVPLMTACVSHLGSSCRRRHQWTTIPDWDRVKDRKTPMA